MQVSLTLTVVTRARVGSGRDREERKQKRSRRKPGRKRGEIRRPLEGAEEVPAAVSGGRRQVCGPWEGLVDRGVAESEGRGHFRPRGLRSKSTPVAPRGSFDHICTVLGCLSR